MDVAHSTSNALLDQLDQVPLDHIAKIEKTKLERQLAECQKERDDWRTRALAAEATLGAIFATASSYAPDTGSHQNARLEGRKASNTNTKDERSRGGARRQTNVRPPPAQKEQPPVASGGTPSTSAPSSTAPAALAPPPNPATVLKAETAAQVSPDERNKPLSEVKDVLRDAMAAIEHKLEEKDARVTQQKDCKTEDLTLERREAKTEQKGSTAAPSKRPTTSSDQRNSHKRRRTELDCVLVSLPSQDLRRATASTEQRTLHTNSTSCASHTNSTTVSEFHTTAAASVSDTKSKASVSRAAFTASQLQRRATLQASSTKTSQASSTNTQQAPRQEPLATGEPLAKPTPAGSSKAEQAAMSSKTEEARSSKAEQAGSSKAEQAGSSKVEKAGSSKAAIAAEPLGQPASHTSAQSRQAVAAGALVPAELPSSDCRRASGRMTVPTWRARESKAGLKMPGAMAQTVTPKLPPKSAVDQKPTIDQKPIATRKSTVAQKTANTQKSFTAQKSTTDQKAITTQTDNKDLSVAALLATTPSLPIPADLASVPNVSRRFLCQLYGSNENSLVALLHTKPYTGSRLQTGTARVSVVFANPQMNPRLPTRPGAPGVLLTRRTDVLFDRPTALFVCRGANEWQYVGNYTSYSKRALSVEEFCAMGDEVQRTWAKSIAAKKMPQCWRNMRTVVFGDGEPRAKNRAAEDRMLQALRDGTTYLEVILFECKAYDRRIAEDLADWWTRQPELQGLYSHSQGARTPTAAVSKRALPQEPSSQRSSAHRKRPRTLMAQTEDVDDDGEDSDYRPG